MGRTYILGGDQTDFAKNWTKAGGGIYDILEASTLGALSATGIDPKDVDAAHIGNFVGELFCNQGQLGGLFARIDPAFAGIPAARHEAACASGSMAALAAMAEIEARRYDLICVSGLELMRNVDGKTGAEYLGAAAWAGHEAEDSEFLWPYMFNEILEMYHERFGVDQSHLAAIAKKNLGNAKNNPTAQARSWEFEEGHFGTNDEMNPCIEGNLRKQDCGRITDGGATIFLASESYAKSYAEKRNLDLDSIPFIKGWGHRTAPMPLEKNLATGVNQKYPFPYLRAAIEDALSRAELSDIRDVDMIETHDCFTITEYVAMDHFGFTDPGKAWQSIENGETAMDGSLPINPSGGLIGAGHPVGATGVRMLLDAYKQITGTAGDYQVDNTKNVATLNIGGSFTTTASFVVGRG